MNDVIERKLTTILAADVAGSSRHMERDEAAAVGALRRGRATFQRLIERHRGRIANTAGDGLIADFPSVVEAVLCAVEVQRELADLEVGPAEPMRFRIGIHLGDVMVEGQDILGEGVNLAARLQAMAAPGGVLVSRPVLDQVRHKLSFAFEPLGRHRMRNFAGEFEVFGIVPTDAPVAAAPAAKPSAGNRADPSALPSAVGSARLQPWRRVLVVSGGLVAIDAVTSGGPWAQFPMLAVVTATAVAEAPRLAPALEPRLARGLALTLGLAGLNLVTWNGTFWAAIPAIVAAVWYGWSRR